MYDPETEEAEKKSKQQQTIVAPPLPPPELTKSGKPLTKKERKEVSTSAHCLNWSHLKAAPVQESNCRARLVRYACSC